MKILQRGDGGEQARPMQEIRMKAQTWRRVRRGQES
jgi:hypothetical protein